ncbi:hypothetical protein GCM10022226_18860 [Sphaerisporangium flaviroseum]|uniref:Uncharacterized protein n=1 Tax=Sphaerisporangium flaviroseum TaxID=509199 RepID=A0ABP7HRL0_9ACTN
MCSIACSVNDMEEFSSLGTADDDPPPLPVGAVSTPQPMASRNLTTHLLPAVTAITRLRRRAIPQPHPAASSR